MRQRKKQHSRNQYATVSIRAPRKKYGLFDPHQSLPVDTSAGHDMRLLRTLKFVVIPDRFQWTAPLNFVTNKKITQTNNSTFCVYFLAGLMQKKERFFTQSSLTGQLG